jgi:hypothetical protein
LNFPEGTDEITKYLNKDSLSGMEIWTQFLPNTKQMYQHGPNISNVC